MAQLGVVTKAYENLVAQARWRNVDATVNQRLAEAFLKKHYQPVKRQPASGARMPKLKGERHILGTGEPLEPGYSLHDPSRAWDELVYGLSLTADNWEGRRADVFQAALHDYVLREGHGLVERRPDPESPVKPTSAIETPQKKAKRERLTEKLSARFSKTEHQAIKEVGITPSEYLRDLVDQDMAMRKATSSEPASLVGQDE